MVIPAASPSRSPLGDVLDAKRVKDASYDVIMFQVDSGAASKFALLHRTIAHTSIAGRSAINITERGATDGTTTIVTIDAATL